VLTPQFDRVSVTNPVPYLARDLEVSISWLRRPDTRPQNLASFPRLRSCVLSFDDDLYEPDHGFGLWVTVFQKLQGVADVPQLRLSLAPEMLNLALLELERPQLTGSELAALGQLPMLGRLIFVAHQKHQCPISRPQPGADFSGLAALGACALHSRS